MRRWRSHCICHFLLRLKEVRSGLKIHKAVLWYKVCKYRQQSWRAQSKVKRDPAKGDGLLETSLRVLQEQEDELQEARQEKDRTERQNRQLRHQMENLCTDLGINGFVYGCWPIIVYFCLFAQNRIAFILSLLFGSSSKNDTRNSSSHFCSAVMSSVTFVNSNWNCN